MRDGDVPGSLMTTSSPEVGSAAVLQFVFVSQSPPAGLVQVTVERRTTCSSASIAGRYRERLRDRRRAEANRPAAVRPHFVRTCGWSDMVRLRVRFKDTTTRTLPRMTRRLAARSGR